MTLPDTIPKKYICFCEYCNKTFTRKDNLNRHYNTCKIKKQEESTENETNNITILIKKIDKIAEENSEIKVALVEKDKKIEEIEVKNGEIKEANSIENS